MSTLGPVTNRSSGMNTFVITNRRVQWQQLIRVSAVAKRAGR
jgi:hypothetical protein